MVPPRIPPISTLFPYSILFDEFSHPSFHRLLQSGVTLRLQNQAVNRDMVSDLHLSLTSTASLIRVMYMTMWRDIRKRADWL